MKLLPRALQNGLTAIVHFVATSLLGRPGRGACPEDPWKSHSSALRTIFPGFWKGGWLGDRRITIE
mgnify:CR=1 FL=1